MENQTPQNPQNGAPNQSAPSLLDQIIANSKESVNNTLPNTPISWTGATMPSPNPQNNGTPNPNNKKPRDPMSTATIFKLIGTIFLVGIVFFGSFLTYIVFNPDQAGFFNTVFGVKYEDIANILKQLITVSFGTIAFILSALFMLTLFQAIWTPKEQKRRKISKIITAIFSGIILFVLIFIWAILFTKIQQTNFTNPGGDILVYDNDIFVNEWLENDARVQNLKNIIGPITLRYKISENALRVKRLSGGEITSFSIDFDGARCQSGSSIVTGSNPTTEEAIICTFDQIKDYKPRGEYIIQTYAGEQKVPIIFNNVEVKGLLDINELANKDGEMRKIFDAQKIRSLGTPRWYYLDGTNTEKETDIFSETLSTKPLIVGLKVFKENNLFDPYDRIFIIKTNDKKIDGKIIIKQNVANPQEYTFSLGELNANQADVLSIDWRLNDSTVICQDSGNITCSHIFVTDGQYKIDAVVNLVGNKKINISETLQIHKPLTVERHVKISNRTGKLLNPESTFDARTQRYIIQDLLPPETIILDARDVISNNPGYILKNVEWDISDGRTNEKRIGDRIDFSINRTSRYDIIAEYTFEKTIKTGQSDDIRKAQDKITLDLERKNITPILKITKSSDYVPSRITVDASQSMAEYSDIAKFIYDFGEGRPPAEGDAIQHYQYLTPGEKTITVTVVDTNGQSASTKQTVVLKDTPKALNFTSSLSPGLVNQVVDFKAEWTTGDVESYLWNFGDNTGISHGYSASHTFKQAGEYTVTLTVRYTDGTERNTAQKFKVVTSLE